MARLSEAECRELRELARSETLRRDFDRMRAFSRARSRQASFDDVLKWLTAMSRIFSYARQPQRPFIATNMKL